MNLFGTDGIRGVANAELTCSTAYRLGRGLGVMFGPGARLALGKDTRASGDMLEACLVAGITSAGGNVVRLGVITTPGLSFSVSHAGLGGGVMISASHNPAKYNGLKVFGPEGTKVADEVEDALSRFILEDFSVGGDYFPVGGSIGRVEAGEHFVDAYAEFLISLGGKGLRGLPVVVDAANGAASVLAERVWRGLGARISVINCAPDGDNINLNCGSTHLGSLTEAIGRLGGAIGFAYDGDGDRCMTVDETGREMNGDHMMGVVAQDMASRGALRENTVVGTVMSNFGLEVFLANLGLRLVRTQVGDRFVLETMRQGGYNLGGEQSGHLIFRDVLETGDGILTSILLARLMTDSGCNMSDLRSAIVDLPQILVNVRTESPKKVLEDGEVVNAIEKAQKRLSEKGRVLVRASGTEPLVRIMVESQDETLTVSCIEYLKEVVERKVKE